MNDENDDDNGDDKNVNDDDDDNGADDNLNNYIDYVDDCNDDHAPETHFLNWKKTSRLDIQKGYLLARQRPPQLTLKYSPWLQVFLHYEAQF